MNAKDQILISINDAHLNMGYPEILNKYHISAVLGDGRLLHHTVSAINVSGAIDKFMNEDDIPEDFSRSVSFSVVKYPIDKNLEIKD